MHSPRYYEREITNWEMGGGVNEREEVGEEGGAGGFRTSDIATGILEGWDKGRTAVLTRDSRFSNLPKTSPGSTLAFLVESEQHQANSHATTPG